MPTPRLCAYKFPTLVLTNLLTNSRYQPRLFRLNLSPDDVRYGCGEDLYALHCNHSNQADELEFCTDLERTPQWQRHLSFR